MELLMKFYKNECGNERSIIIRNNKSKTLGYIF